MTNFTQSITLTSGSATAGTRNWFTDPGADGVFWTSPFYNSAKFDTSGAAVTALRNGNKGTPTGFINLKGNYAATFYIGYATDPLVSVEEHDGAGNVIKAIKVRVPKGAVPESPYTGVDSNMGGADTTQPYLCWSIGNASVNTTSGAVEKDGDKIIGVGAGGFDISDGSGNFMCDQETGQLGTGNAYGTIQDWDLTRALADPNYVIPHMLAYSLDPSQVITTGNPIWPLNVIDTSFNGTGSIAQGYTIGINPGTPRPIGKNRMFYLLWDNLLQFGWFFYNLAGAGCLTLACYNSDANAQAATDLQNNISAVMAYASILNNQTGPSSVKGFSPGASLLYPAPPKLDLSPTGGNRVQPHTFQAWYPSTKAPVFKQPDGTITGNDVLG